MPKVERSRLHNFDSSEDCESLGGILKEYKKGFRMFSIATNLQGRRLLRDYTQASNYQEVWKFGVQYLGGLGLYSHTSYWMLRGMRFA